MRGLALHTHSGRSLYPLAPALEAIAIEDIAHALSQLCRFVGQIGAFYSVAQHSVLVSYWCEPADALHGLLHDGAEAYLGDLPRPLKACPGLEGYRACEAHLQALIYQAFGLSAAVPASVAVADDLACHAEAHDLFPVPPAWARDVAFPMSRFRIEPWAPRRAAETFLARFQMLVGARGAA